MCSWCRPKGAGHFPVIFMALIVVTFCLTYILAVYRRDVHPWFPYISDAGGKRPESCVFGQLLNFAAFIGFLIVYLRYRLVKELNRDADELLRRLNIAALIIGSLSSMGMSIVGNFQKNDVLIVHMIGAFMCFINGVIYSCVNVAISYRMYPLYNGISICRIRAFIAASALIAFITSLTTGIIASVIYHHNHPSDHSSPIIWYKMHKDESSYNFHVTSAFFEWVLAISFMSFLLSYARDFEKLRVSIAVEPLVGHLDESVEGATLLIYKQFAQHSL